MIMNNESKKDKLISLCITIAVHALVIVLLVFLGFKYQAPEEESGILLMAGEVELSSSNDKNTSWTMSRARSSSCRSATANRYICA